MTPENTATFRADEPVGLAHASSAGPGRLIRVSRERAKLTVEQLAQQTKLARATLDALERDDFGVLNEAVYVRGYYRKVAKALGISEQELLAAYTHVAAPKAPPAPTKLLLGSNDNGIARSRRGGWLWAVGGLVVLIVILGLVKLFGHGTPSSSAPLTPAGSGNSSSAPVAATHEDLPPAPAPQTSELSTRGSSETSAERPGESPPPQMGTEPRRTGPALATQLSQSPSTTSPSATAAPTPAPANGPVTAESLVMTFKGTSWVKVEDASGKVLVSGVVQEGDHQVYNGRPPYSVFLGNAPGVALEYGGKAVSIAPYVRQNSTARFSVP